MKNIIIPKGYASELNIIETQKAIKEIKDFFETNLANELNLTRVSAPLFVKKNTGINDNLNGSESPVSFSLTESENSQELEIVQSLAKWKRIALKKYNIPVGEGIYTDMNAIRPCEELDNIHSVYVDQWDWERVIKIENRNKFFLKEIVEKIFSVFKRTDEFLSRRFLDYKKILPEKLSFITTQELEDMFPNDTPKEREHKIAKAKKAVFIMQIGDKLVSGNKHDGRSPDYDDWKLNGDLIFWNPVLDSSLELSSMGIRVDKETLLQQLKSSGTEDRKNLDYHKMLLNDELPLTIGGGIGQSRICMFFLQKAHIGEVQSSFWSDEMLEICKKNKINLL
ncbi:MAG: aspartate--ammonia ligase [Peptoniphilaceae bacterium]|uniref:aspartate--ammonia ligase n=1 Tax=Parvimonas sp. TaxID=1944660 RepID=UPI0025F6B543|nr:aspartate--ammonia ligase [Parvimonas sp.]MCI5998016.1 aspartate--ammonia ligase [Parvimonas sp.]MDD7764398.1 aspartate--ammonia ligase [Peptoniphilaceae bacterium]MDY3051392.1 aspartate--ammonia ligase [Parvimonas sp.]